MSKENPNEFKIINKNERLKYRLIINALKQQLAEKEKELAYMIKQAKKFNNEAQKYYEDAYCNSFQNQKAITELEKVKKTLSAYVRADHIIWDFNVNEVIDQQIKELKGE